MSGFALYRGDLENRENLKNLSKISGEGCSKFVLQNM